MTDLQDSVFERPPSRSARANENECLPSEGFHERDLLVKGHLSLVEFVVLFRFKELLAFLTGHKGTTQTNLRNQKDASK